MLKKIIIGCWLWGIAISVSGQELLPAFPGAEGHGKYVTGGRGGRVIAVTNLNDNGPGSLRAAIEATGPRLVVFRISGTIQLKSNISIRNDNITIAGQSAPGDGICLRDYPVTVDANNVIIRFMRFRMGDEAKQEGDALGGRFMNRILIDHCSMSWSTDECVSFYQNETFTLQWCIIAESLRNSVHGKGAHGYGGIFGGKNASFHHNLLAHHDSRNPRLGESAGNIFALTDAVDLRNNVIYNWVGNSCYGGEAMNVNIVNCYYKPGPGTTKPSRIISIDKLTDAGTAISDTWGKFYINGNVLTGSSSATNDNWTYGVYNQFNSKYGTVVQTEKNAMRLNVSLNSGEVTTHPAEMAYAQVLDYAGASLKRDAVDLRIIHDVRTGTATFMDGGNGSVKGIIDTQRAVGGWPALISTEAPADSDNDGMADTWEAANGLSPSYAADAQQKTVDGIYPNIEVYLNSLVAKIVENQNANALTSSFAIHKNGENSPKVFFDGSTEKLNISHSSKVKKVQLYAVTGVLLLEVITNDAVLQIQLPRLHKSIYIVRMQDEQNRLFSTKIIGHSRS